MSNPNRNFFMPPPQSKAMTWFAVSFRERPSFRVLFRVCVKSSLTVSVSCRPSVPSRVLLTLLHHLLPLNCDFDPPCPPPRPVPCFHIKKGSTWFFGICSCVRKDRSKFFQNWQVLCKPLSGNLQIPRNRFLKALLFYRLSINS